MGEPIADLLGATAFYRLRSTPRRPVEPDRPDPVPAQLFAALTGAYAQFTAAASERPCLLVTAWQRLPGEPHLRVLFGGHPGFPGGAVGETVPVLYPPGSRAEVVATEEVLASWADYPAWVVCTGQPDALWAPDDSHRQQSRGGFDDYVAHLGDSFVWLTIAEPLAGDHIDREIAELALRIPQLRLRERDEAGRIALHRASGRYRDLSRARTTGMWQVRVLVAGTTPAGAQRAAALLCGSSDLDDQPFTLAPSQPGTFAEALAATVTTPDGHSYPFQANSELLAALARPPKRELAGVRLVERADFDLTPETEGTLLLGDILDDADQPVGPFTVTLQTLNRHTFVAGATGAGKSQTVRHLLDQLHGADVPWLVIEPAKAEYRRMAGRVGDVMVIRPGAPDALPVGLNPLEPAEGFPIQTHIDLVRALFLAAFEAEEPFPQVISHALTRCYTDLGWDPVVGEPRLRGVTPKYPDLGDLQRTAMDVVASIGYGKEITDNVRGFIDVRLGSLRLGTTGRFFEGGHPLDIADVLRRNTVLEIEDVGNDLDKAFFIGAILIRLHEYLRTNRASSAELRHVTVIEEAHRLLKNVLPGSPAAHAVELFTALLAEIRAYGEGIVIAEQIPTKIVPDVVKNTALKIIHRLPAADDRETLGATVNLDEAQSRHVVSLPPGRAVAFADGMDRPIRIAVPLGQEREAETLSSPPAILRRRSTACGQQCHTRACVLREMNRAINFADDPRLTLWLELLTTAHLVGRPSPLPDRTWLDQLLNSADRRTLECAIAHRLHTATAHRYHGLFLHYQPEALTEHLAAAALGQLDGTSQPCDGSEVDWQAGTFRWVDVMLALKTAPAAGQPHRDSAAWAARGLHLFGDTIGDQLTALRAHPDSWYPDHSVITGGDTVHDAASRLSRAVNRRVRLAEASRFLTMKTDWALAVFAGDDPVTV
ncbi:ATP-binding protein [Saccharothrix sp. 6-C]|uniref:ATP-binding protein n=1 Tax=Saccharothrix sp. 6-C TaxID=2781735 RepID=UPI0019170139|nr:ATP-binding protein [Saccharothrix sp. 6-C]QQQ80138.1 ATP-binding protein [Saccharothrix sp. 6-C]